MRQFQHRIVPEQIVTKRLILRAFCMEDEQAMFKNWTSDPQVARFMAGKAHSSPAITRGVLESFCYHSSRGNLHWAIVPNRALCDENCLTAGEPMGSVSIVRFDSMRKEAELGYALSRVLWGQGIMPEAIEAVMEWAVSHLGVKQFSAQVFAGNEASVRVLKKCGFSHTSTRQDGACRNTGEPADVLVFKKRGR